MASTNLLFSQRSATISLVVWYAVCAIVARTLGPESLLTQLLLVAFPAGVIALGWSFARNPSPESFPTPTIGTSIFGKAQARLGFPKAGTTHIAMTMAAVWPLTRRLMLPDGVSDLWLVGYLVWWMASAAFIGFGIPRLVSAPKAPVTLNSRTE